jgi:hypothetical protein
VLEGVEVNVVHQYAQVATDRSISIRSVVQPAIDANLLPFFAIDHVRVQLDEEEGCDQWFDADLGLFRLSCTSLTL